MDGTLILLVVLLIIAIILLIVALRAGASGRAARRGAGVGAEQASTPVAPEGAVPDPARVQMPPAQLATSPSSMGASGFGAPPAMAGQPIASREANAPDDTWPTATAAFTPAPEAAGEAPPTTQTMQGTVGTAHEGAQHEGAQKAGEEEQPDAAAFTVAGTSAPSQPETARQVGRADDGGDGRGGAAAGELVPQPATRSGEIRLAATPGRLPYRLAELVGEQRQLEESISLAHRRLDEIELGHDAGSTENRVRLGILRQDLAQKQERLREILYLQDGYYWLQQQMAPDRQLAEPAETRG